MQSQKNSGNISSENRWALVGALLVFITYIASSTLLAIFQSRAKLLDEEEKYSKVEDQNGKWYEGQN